MTWRVFGLALIVLAAVQAAAAVGICGWGEPEAGVAAGDPGSTISWVLPGGPSWADGIRTGQTVVELESGIRRSSWRLVTTDGQSSYATSYPSQTDRLRQALPIALIGAALVAVALVVMTGTAISVALAAVSLLFSANAIESSGYQFLGMAALMLALFAPIAWLIACGSPPTTVRVGLVALSTAVAAEWLTTVYLMPSSFDLADFARQGTSIGVDLALLAFCADVRLWRRRVLDLDSRRAADVVAVVALIAITVFVSLVLAFPAAFVVIGIAAASLLYPGFRRSLAQAMDQILLGDIRERASIKAVEEERSRIARDLHDAPLQDIAVVIRALDRKADTERETELLRRVADRLRRVTIELRPPILDDLGLRAAIAYLGDVAGEDTSGVAVEVSLVPDDPLAERPPADVELAVYRILREAVDNALHHAEADHLLIQATVLPEQVDAVVQDNGTGIATKARRDAASSGHLGLVSMAQRAALIGADFEIQRVSPHGTRVRVAWRAGR